MKAKVIIVLSDGTIVLKPIPDKEDIEMPVANEEYYVYFEKIEPPIPEFNR